MRAFRYLAALLVVGLISMPAGAALVNYDEFEDGELSNLHGTEAEGGAPTFLGTFGIGVNTVSGIVSHAESNDPDIRNTDIFTFVIAPGTQLDSIIVTEFFSESNIGFAALTRGAFFPYDDAGLNDLSFENPYSGIGLSGFAYETVFFNETFNGMSNLAETFGSPGFIAPLGPDTYTMYVQENSNSLTGYTFAFSVSASAIPEPSSAAVLGFVSSLLVLRRRR